MAVPVSRGYCGVQRICEQLDSISCRLQYCCEPWYIRYQCVSRAIDTITPGMNFNVYAVYLTLKDTTPIWVVEYSLLDLSISPYVQQSATLQVPSIVQTHRPTEAQSRPASSSTPTWYTSTQLPTHKDSIVQCTLRLGTRAMLLMSDVRKAMTIG